MYPEFYKIEQIIFRNTKSHFEKLPSMLNNEYPKAFSDIIAVWGYGADPLLNLSDENLDVISKQLKEEFYKLLLYQQSALLKHYEVYHLQRFKNWDNDDLYYNIDDFIEAVFSNFIIWVKDNFSTDNLPNTGGIPPGQLNT